MSVGPPENEGMWASRAEVFSGLTFLVLFVLTQKEVLPGRLKSGHISYPAPPLMRNVIKVYNNPLRIIVSRRFSPVPPPGIALYYHHVTYAKRCTCYYYIFPLMPSGKSGQTSM
jgi:hypothetical protein